MNAFISIICILLILSCFISNQTIADEIYLKNGDRISGELIHFSSNLCTFATPYQATLRIKRHHINSLNTNQPVIVELSSGDRLVGTLNSHSKNSKFYLHSQRLGKISLQLAEIIEIVLPNQKKSAHSKTSSQPKKKKNQPIQTSQSKTKKTLKPVATPKKPSSPETVGQKNKAAPQQLFRKNNFLLKQGEKELTLSLSYTYDLSTEQRERNLSVPVGFYMGLTEKMEGFINVPFNWIESEVFTSETVNKESHFNLGDISIGLNYLLMPEQKSYPDIIGSLSLTLPIGKQLNELENISWEPGYWQMTSGLTFVKTYDPAILFGGLDYTYRLGHTTNEAQGNIWSYRFGVGFAINYQLALFGQFLSDYENRNDNTPRKKRSFAYESMLLQAGLTYFLSQHRYLQPTLTFGLNNDATEITLDLSYIHRF